MIVVTGASGQLGSAFRRCLGEDATYLDRKALDLSDVSGVRAVIESLDPTMVINCAAYTAVDAAESDQDIARTVNADAVGELAAVCRDIGAKFVTFSTDYVFDGSKPSAYVESDQTNPINVYGATKHEGELSALANDPSSLVIRTSWVMSGTHRSFASVMQGLIRRGPVTVVSDQRGRPTFVDDLASGTLDAIDKDVDGILHLTNSGSASWYEIARSIAVLDGRDPDLVTPCRTDQYPTAASRPANSILDSERTATLGLEPLRDWRLALEAAIVEIRLHRVAG